MRSRYARWRSLLDHRHQRPTYIRRSSSEGALAPERIETHPRKAAGGGGLDTLPSPRYSTTQLGLVVHQGGDVDRRRTAAIRRSSSEGALAPERIETHP